MKTPQIINLLDLDIYLPQVSLYFEAELMPFSPSRLLWLCGQLWIFHQQYGFIPSLKDAVQVHS
jgi:hypothetical protein